MNPQMAHPATRSTALTILRLVYRAVVLGSAAGLFWIAGVCAIAGLTTSAGYLGLGFVLALLALGIAYFGWRQS